MVDALRSFAHRNRTPLTHGAVLGLWSASAIWVWLLTVAQGPRGPEGGWVGVDSYAYWYAFQHDLYGYDEVVSPGALTGRYLYSPLFAQVLWPVTRLPWEGFAPLWSIAMAAVFWWLLRPLAVRWRVPAFVFLCLEEVILGNVRALIAVALVLALRHPALWAIPLLTKVASGVGVLWPVMRREWRKVAVLLLTLLGLVAVSVALDPQLWLDWIAFLRQEIVVPTGGYPLAVARGLTAVAIVVVAARQGRPHWLAPATALASPVIYLADLSLLAAMPRLYAQRDLQTGPAPAEPPAERRPSTHG